MPCNEVITMVSKLFSTPFSIPHFRVKQCFCVPLPFFSSKTANTLWCFLANGKPFDQCCQTHSAISDRNWSRQAFTDSNFDSDSVLPERSTPTDSNPVFDWDSTALPTSAFDKSQTYNFTLLSKGKLSDAPSHSLSNLWEMVEDTKRLVGESVKASLYSWVVYNFVPRR